MPAKPLKSGIQGIDYTKEVITGRIKVIINNKKIIIGHDRKEAAAVLKGRKIKPSVNCQTIQKQVISIKKSNHKE